MRVYRYQSWLRARNLCVMVLAPAEGDLAAPFLAYAVMRLEQLHTLVEACCERLTPEQMMQRDGDYENSVANLLLHLSGNLKQWVVHGVGGFADARRRDAEFALNGLPCVTEIRADFAETVSHAKQVIASVPHERLLEIVDPQPTGRHRNVSVLVAIAKAVGHVEHHAGQVVVLTKQLVGGDLDFSLPRKR